MPPVADAVRLVDGDEREAHALQRRADRALQPLGRGVDELEARPRRTAGTRARRSSGSRLELRKVARRPTRAMASTWSFMSAMSGETTSTVPPPAPPPSIRAGIW